MVRSGNTDENHSRLNLDFFLFFYEIEADFIITGF